MDPISAIITAGQVVGIIQKLAVACGLIETLDMKIERKLDTIIQAPLKSATGLIKRAHRSPTDELRLDYIRRALFNLSDAAAMEEKGGRRALVYYLSAQCSFMLGDDHNSNEDLRQVLEVALVPKASTARLYMNSIRNQIDYYDLYLGMVLQEGVSQRLGYPPDHERLALISTVENKMRAEPPSLGKQILKGFRAAYAPILLLPDLLEAHAEKELQEKLSRPHNSSYPVSATAPALTRRDGPRARIILEEVGFMDEKVAKTVVSLLGITLRDARRLISDTPCVLGTGPLEKAQQYKAVFENDGAKVRLEVREQLEPPSPPESDPTSTPMPTSKLTQTYLVKLEANPNDLTTVARLENLYGARGQWSELVTLLRDRAREANANALAARLLFESGRVAALHLEDAELAAQLLDLAYEAGAETKVAHEIQLYTLALRQRWDELQGFFALAVGQMSDPTDQSRLYFQLGVVLDELLGDHEQADQMYSYAFHRDMTNLAAMWCRQQLAAKTSAWERIAELFYAELQRTEDVERQIELMLDLGDVYHERLGQDDAALQSYRNVYEYDNTNPRALAGLTSLGVDVGGSHPGTQTQVWSPEARSPSEKHPRLLPMGLDASMIVLDQQYIEVGRDQANDCVLRSKRVSRKHAQIVNLGGRCCVRDHSSTGGTYVCGERVDGVSRFLVDGDLVAFGDVEFIYKEPT